MQARSWESDSQSNEIQRKGDLCCGHSGQANRHQDNLATTDHALPDIAVNMTMTMTMPRLMDIHMTTMPATQMMMLLLIMFMIIHTIIVLMIMLVRVLMLTTGMMTTMTS